MAVTDDRPAGEVAEAFFILALVTAAWLALWRPRDVRALAPVGALLAGATLLRSAGVFAVPVFAAYLLWARAGVRALAVAATVTVLPLVAYGAMLQSRWGAFGLTVHDGWFLYGRVAEILRCAGTGPPAHPAAGLPRDRGGRRSGRGLPDLGSRQSREPCLPRSRDRPCGAAAIQRRAAGSRAAGRRGPARRLRRNRRP